MPAAPDPSTPVLVGVGQSSERLGEPGYRRRSPVELAADAARAALRDCGADPGEVALVLDTVAAVRQFEASLPWAVPPLGASDNVPRSVARRVGAHPARAVLEVVGGQSPQHLLTELAGVVAAGEARAVLVVGAEALSTVRALAGTDDAPDWTERVVGQLEDRGLGLEGLLTGPVLAHGLDVVAQYALLETARRGRLGRTRAQYACDMAELFAPFTRVAAANPHAASREVLTAQELATPSGRNRPVADPYTRLLVARDQVNQGAAALLLSVATAERLGVPRERWVFLHGHADLRERDLLDRADLGSSPASVLAVQHALDVAGVRLDDVDVLDLYSCFPVAVSNLCDGLGLAPDDPRGLTVTGGLPYFGGPGNDYALHAVAEVAQRLRAAPGSVGLVAANGGVLSKLSAGVWSTTPAPWREDRSAALQAEVDAWPAPQVVERADGPASVETCTVVHDRQGGRRGVVVGRLDAGGRFLATTEPGDEAALDLLAGDAPFGAPVVVRATDQGNRVALGR